MYCMRRAALRKYTFAALNGAGEVTLPETLASPLSSDCAAALALQPTNESAASKMAMRMRGASSTKTSRIYSGPQRSASRPATFLATMPRHAPRRGRARLPRWKAGPGAEARARAPGQGRRLLRLGGLRRRDAG